SYLYHYLEVIAMRKSFLLGLASLLITGWSNAQAVELWPAMDRKSEVSNDISGKGIVFCEKSPIGNLEDDSCVIKIFMLEAGNSIVTVDNSEGLREVFAG